MDAEQTFFVAHVTHRNADALNWWTNHDTATPITLPEARDLARDLESPVSLARDPDGERVLEVDASGDYRWL